MHQVLNVLRLWIWHGRIYKGYADPDEKINRFLTNINQYLTNISQFQPNKTDT